MIVGLALGAGSSHGRLSAKAIPFSARPISTVINQTPAVTVADLDGDGDLDALSATFTDNTVAWHENTDGDGTFAPRQVISTLADGPVSVAAADVDGDGDTDALSASVFDNKIAWYENVLGDGSLWTHRIISIEVDGASSVYATDVDGDGDTDVVSASLDEGDIAWHGNIGGAGTSWIKIDISTNCPEAQAVYAADVDGDGDTDVLSAAADDLKISWHANDNGDGSSWTEHPISTNADGANSVYALDIDGDGDIDVLSASRGDDKIAWYENERGDGSLWEPNTISTDAVNARSVFALDLDEDGDADVLSASLGDDKIAWYENADGVGTSWQERAISTTATDAVAVFAADIDGDGDADVLSAALAAQTTWYENRTIHRSVRFAGEESVDSVDGPSSVSAVDVDGDGDLDLFSASANDDEITFHENVSGDGSFVERIVGTVDYPRSVFAVDLDKDGDVDVLSASGHPFFGGDELAWFSNDGDALSWSATTITQAPVGLASAYAIDVDGDGDLDVLSASGGDDTIAWHQNLDGAGSSWTQLTISATADGAASVFAADVDRDGDADVLAASFNDDTIAWHENSNGIGTSWIEHIVSTTADGASSVFLVDVDRDGDPDVLSTSFNDDTVAWHENSNGIGTSWIEHIVSATADGARSVLPADLDGDGDLDVVTASFNGNVVSWHENTGDGLLWQEHLLESTLSGAQSVSTGDVDGDGDLDALMAFFSDDRIAFFENRGGQFALPTTSLAQGVLFDSQEEVVFQIDPEHLGRAGDTAAELATIELRFRDSGGAPLSPTDTIALIHKVELFLDDGSGSFEASADTLVEIISPLSPGPGGSQTIHLMTGDPNALLELGSSKRFFVVITMTSNARAQRPDSFRVAHSTSGGVTSTARDALFPGAELTLLPSVSTSTGTIDTDLASSTCRAPFGLDLQGFAVTTAVVCEAGTVLSAGTGLTVSIAGNLTLRAGEAIQLRPNFRVEPGGKLTVEVDSSLQP